MARIWAPSPVAMAAKKAVLNVDVAENLDNHFVWEISELAMLLVGGPT